MSVLLLLGAVLATAVVVWLSNQKKIPQVFEWVVYAVLIVLWLFFVAYLLGFTDMAIRPMR